MIRIDLKPILSRLLRGVPMPVIAILVGLVAGMLVWGVLEQIQSEQVGRIFGQELESRLALRARESLMRFQQYLGQYAAMTRLIAKHRLLADYLESGRWNRGEGVSLVRHEERRPSWLPDFLERDGLLPPSQVLLVDREGVPREIYDSGAASLPGEIGTGVGSNRRDDLDVRTFLAEFDGRVFLVVSDAIEDSQGLVMGSLVVIVLVNQAFLTASQRGLLAEDTALALVNADDERVLVSQAPDWLTPGTSLSLWRQEYLITSQSWQGYEDSDLTLLFTTLVSHASVERMSRHVRIFERRQRGIAALVFIASFTLVIYLVSARINKVLQRLSGFARWALEIEDPGFRPGANQLILLEDWVQRFTQLVLWAREETSRRHALAMRESEALKAAVMEAALDSIISLDRGGRIRELNPTAERTFGYVRRQVLGRSFSRLLLAASSQVNFYALLREGRRAQREGREPQTRSELLAQRADTTLVPMEVSVVTFELGDELFHTLYLHDITKRKERDLEIRSLAGFASESPIPMLRLSPGGTLLYANRASEALLKSWSETGEKPLPEAWLGLAREALAVGGQREAEFRFANQVYACLFFPVKELGYVNIYARDITAIRRAEQELRRHQAELVHVCRLSTMGEVATGMAHELNQPLAAIVNYASGCGRRLRAGTGQSEELAQVMDHIGRQAQRAGEIIKRLRALVGKQAPVRGRVDLNNMVAEVCAFAEFETAKLGLAIDLDLAAGELPVWVDLVQIEQVLLNLVRNALEALAEVPPLRRHLVIRTRREAGWAITLVEDQGPGIDPEDMKRLFDPFFTTKNNGMGMGLPISQTIIDNHGGEIRASSEPGVGTRFAVRLPLADAAE